jgi:hypothetical protein
VRGRLNRADDPGFWARAGAVCRLCLDPPPGTVLVSIDEKTGIPSDDGVGSAASAAASSAGVPAVSVPAAAAIA